jgi:hypothetical protein
MRDPAKVTYCADLAEMRRGGKRSPSTELYNFLWDKSAVTLKPPPNQRLAGGCPAAGIDPASLAFSGHVQTANGAARMAPVNLREIRIGQLSIYDVPASVLEHLNVSLLGMSLLSRLQGYEMRDGKLTISW